MIKIEVHSTRAVIRSQEPLTVGLRGATARFSFGEPWEHLIKAAVFRQGEKTVTVADIGPEVTIPWEVLTQAGLPVQIGVYGTDSTETVVIPTVWAATQPVRPGTALEGDPSTEPTPGLWEQLQGKLGSLEQLDTTDKSSLVGAINEANRPVFLVTVSQAADGSYGADHDVSTIQAALDAKLPLACYWYEECVMTSLAGFQENGPFEFTAVSGISEYRIVINDNYVNCSVIELAKSDDIPTKTSDLENDSGFLTEAPVKSVNGQTGDVHITIPGAVSQLANDMGYLTKAPVTSVNGQTGDVTVPTAVKVTVTQQADGSYDADLHSEEIMEASNAGKMVYCQNGYRVLTLLYATYSRCIFGCVHAGYVHTVTIGASGVSVASTPLASGGGLSVTDDGNGNVTVASTGGIAITDDGDGNVTIG